MTTWTNPLVLILFYSSFEYDISNFLLFQYSNIFFFGILLCKNITFLINIHIYTGKWRSFFSVITMHLHNLKHNALFWSWKLLIDGVFHAIFTKQRTIVSTKCHSAVNSKICNIYKNICLLWYHKRNTFHMHKTVTSSQNIHIHHLITVRIYMNLICTSLLKVCRAVSAASWSPVSIFSMMTFKSIFIAVPPFCFQEEPKIM